MNNITMMVLLEVQMLRIINIVIYVVIVIIKRNIILYSQVMMNLILEFVEIAIMKQVRMDT